MRFARVALVVVLLAGCALFEPPDRSEQIAVAVAELAASGFSFESDVRFRADRYAVCEGIACADVAVREGHRTVLIARGAFESPSRLRATLLEIWERYREPRPGSVPDLARAALRVLHDGPRVGVEQPVLRRAEHVYRGLWTELREEQRAGLPHPDRARAERPSILDQAGQVR